MGAGGGSWMCPSKLFPDSISNLKILLRIMISRCLDDRLDGESTAEERCAKKAIVLKA
jgi:hypothetical protein